MRTIGSSKGIFFDACIMKLENNTVRHNPLGYSSLRMRLQDDDQVGTANIVSISASILTRSGAHVHCWVNHLGDFDERLLGDGFWR